MKTLFLSYIIGILFFPLLIQTEIQYEILDIECNQETERKCYTLYNHTDGGLSRYTADTLCTEEQQQLASVPDLLTQGIMERLGQTGSGSGIWTAGRVHSDDVWREKDGTVVINSALLSYAIVSLSRRSVNGLVLLSQQTLSLLDPKLKDINTTVYVNLNISTSTNCVYADIGSDVVLGTEECTNERSPLCSYALPASGCSEDDHQSELVCYRRLPDDVTWYAALAACESLNMELATPDVEMGTLLTRTPANIIQQLGQIWLDINRHPWVWGSDELEPKPMLYYNWAPGYGTNSPGDCLQLDGETMLWKNALCDSEETAQFFICENRTVVQSNVGKQEPEGTPSTPSTSTVILTSSVPTTPPPSQIWYIIVSSVGGGLVIIVIAVVTVVVLRRKTKSSQNQMIESTETHNNEGHTQDIVTYDEIYDEIEDVNDEYTIIQDNDLGSSIDKNKIGIRSAGIALPDYPDNTGDNTGGHSFPVHKERISAEMNIKDDYITTEMKFNSTVDGYITAEMNPDVINDDYITTDRNPGSVVDDYNMTMISPEISDGQDIRSSYITTSSVHNLCDMPVPPSDVNGVNIPLDGVTQVNTPPDGVTGNAETVVDI